MNLGILHNNNILKYARICFIMSYMLAWIIMLTLSRQPCHFYNMEPFSEGY